MTHAAAAWSGMGTGDWQAGDLIDGKYEVEVRLGAGAMGVVYRARHVGLDTQVALKVMRSELQRDASNSERMLREARAAAALRHENVVRVLDVGRLQSGVPFIVMEYLEGEDLEQRLATRRALPANEAISWVLQACAGLQAAHRQGIVHRDLKPANLFITTQPDGSELLKVFDFGIAKQLGGRALGTTRPFDTVGSPVYMSPEQMTPGSTIDARSDIWALGVVLTELCTGQLPFDADSLARLFGLLMNGKPRLPSELAANMPPALDAIVQRCLEKDPAARFANVSELALALEALLPRAPEASEQRHSDWQRAHAPRFSTSAGLSAPVRASRDATPTSVQASNVAAKRPWARWGALATLALSAVVWFADRAEHGLQAGVAMSTSPIVTAPPIVTAAPPALASGPADPSANQAIDVIPTPTVSPAPHLGVTTPPGVPSASKPRARPRKAEPASPAGAPRTAPSPWSIESFGGRR